MYLLHSHNFNLICRRKMACTECADLRKTLEEQKSQIGRYEAKIKDLVNAYKSLTTEKQSLEVALNLFSGKEEDTMQDEQEEENASEASSGSEKPVSQLDSLKQAISSLTLVNKRKEMEFRRDRKSLVEAKDALERRCAELEQLLKTQKQQSRSQSLKQLREQLAESRSNYDRTMTEHGLVLAEMQQQYGKEKRRVEGLEKQIMEMSQSNAKKDELLRRAEVQLKQMTQMEQEVQALKKKAELTPTVRIMQNELANVKISCDQELVTLRTRYALQSAQLRERDARIEQMEQRVREVSERSVHAEKQNIELEGQLAELEKRVRAEKTENERLRKGEVNNGDKSGTEQLRELYARIKCKEPDFDVLAALSISSPLAGGPPQRPSSMCSGDPTSSAAGQAHLVPAAASTSDGPSRNGSSISLMSVFGAEMPPAPAPIFCQMDDENNACNACLASRQELDYFKSLIGHLQRKLGNLEVNHEKTKKEHETAADVLRQRIIELEGSQQQTFAKLTAEARQKVAELEEELNKQRLRVVEIMAEKDREIELTKSSLAALYARNYGQEEADDPAVPGAESSSTALPMDPQPMRKSSLQHNPFPQHSPPMHHYEGRDGPPLRTTTPPTGRNKLAEVRRCETGESVDSVVGGGGGRHSPAAMDYAVASHVSFASRRLSRASLLTGTTAAQFGGDGATVRNIFYEQELCKREQEIGELRNVIRLLELKVRDIEQAMLMKDIQYLQIIEALKEEIRVLEGRLSLASSQTNMPYLRNIFVQLLNQGSANGRKHILKAIGAVLQLTAAEMRRVDKWSY